MLRKLVELQFQRGATGYSHRADQAYRGTLAIVRRDLKCIPCTARLRFPSGALPRTLAEEFDERHKRYWDVCGRKDFARFQGRVLTALTAAGLACWPQGPASPSADTPAPAVGSAGAPAGSNRAPCPPAHRAQRRAAQRRTQARLLRDQGRAIKEIARELGCSDRTVYSYLQDVQ